MNCNSQPLVSVVTPAYNEQKHLAECIESVLAQTYKNWDYTILDNQSTDRSVEIATRYAQSDSRIRVVRNSQHLPMIQNHNAALRQISPDSKYCKLLFGDDWMFPECLQRMVSLAEEQASIGVVGAYRLQGQQVTCTGLPYSTTLVSGREICRDQFLRGLYVFGSATNVLYRADLVRSHDPFYNEANIHGDTEALFVLFKACDFGFVHQVLTYTRMEQDSQRTTSDDMAFNVPAKLRLLLHHGADFLTPQELTICLEQHLSDYYRFFGKSLLLGRDRTFWDYHKERMAELNVPFSRSRVIRGALAELGDAILNPKHSLEKLRRRRKLARKASGTIQAHTSKTSTEPVSRIA